LTASLARIQVFPVKSLDPCWIDQGVVLPSGGLQHDRRFAIVDAAGKWVNGKRLPLLHRIRSSFNLDTERIDLELDGRGQSFHPEKERAALEAWLTERLAFPVQIKENCQNGFPDDLDAPGPTVISTATVETVTSWFPGLTADDVRGRFRANLEISGVEPFWEDRLCSEPGFVVQFQIGNVFFEGVYPCQRCPVPTRNHRTGAPLAGFQKTFARQREATLPSWATPSRFDHFYKLAVNTRLASAKLAATIKVGDAVRIVDAV
jgi:uncharacterized protein